MYGGNDDRNPRERAAGPRQHRARIVDSHQGHGAEPLRTAHETGKDADGVGRALRVQAGDGNAVLFEFGAVIAGRQNAHHVHVETERPESRRGVEQLLFGAAPKQTGGHETDPVRSLPRRSRQGESRA